VVLTAVGKFLGLGRFAGFCANVPLR